MIISAVHVDQGGLEVGMSFLMNSGKRCSHVHLSVLSFNLLVLARLRL